MYGGYNAQGYQQVGSKIQGAYQIGKELNRPGAIIIEYNTDPYVDNVVLWFRPYLGDTQDYSKYSRAVIADSAVINDTNSHLRLQAMQSGDVTWEDIPEAAINTNEFCFELWQDILTISGGEYRTIRTRINSPWTTTPNFGAQNYANMGMVRDGIAWDGQVAGTYYTGWQHLAWVRRGGSIYTYVDGTQRGSFGNTINYNGTRDGTQITTFRGPIEAARITIGVPRYTANFNPLEDSLF